MMCGSEKRHTCVFWQYLVTALLCLAKQTGKPVASGLIKVMCCMPLLVNLVSTCFGIKLNCGWMLEKHFRCGPATGTCLRLAKEKYGPVLFQKMLFGPARSCMRMA